MASSQVEIAASPAFNCVMRDHKCQDRNVRAAHAAFENNLKVFVRDHLHNCHIPTPDPDNNSNVKCREVSDCFPKPPNRVLDRWPVKTGGNEKQSQESASHLKESNFHNASSSSSSSSSSNPRRENNESQEHPHPNQPETSSRNEILGGASTLVQMWEARLHPSSSRTSSNLSNAESPLSDEGSKESETVESLDGGNNNNDTNNSQTTNNGDETDWDSQFDKTCVSDAAEKERVRVVDIIRRLRNDHEPVNNNNNISVGGNESTPGRDRKLSLSLQDQAVEARGLLHLVFTPRIRGRQAFADLLMIMERERQRELDSLVERHAVSKFTHRGRLQSMLKIRCVERCKAIQDHHRSRCAASDLNRLPQGSGLMHLRGKFQMNGENSTAARADATNANNIVESRSSSVSSQASEDSHLPEASTRGHSRASLVKDKMLHRSTDIPEASDANNEEKSCIRRQETAEASCLHPQETAEKATCQEVPEKSCLLTGGETTTSQGTMKRTTSKETADKTVSRKTEENLIPRKTAERTLLREIADKTHQETAEKALEREAAEKTNLRVAADKSTLRKTGERTISKKTDEETLPRATPEKTKCDPVEKAFALETTVKIIARGTEEKAIPCENALKIIAHEAAEKSIAREAVLKAIARESTKQAISREIVAKAIPQETEEKFCNRETTEKTIPREDTKRSASRGIIDDTTSQETSNMQETAEATKGEEETSKETTLHESVEKSTSQETAKLPEDRSVAASHKSGDKKGTKSEEETSERTDSRGPGETTSSTILDEHEKPKGEEVEKNQKLLLLDFIENSGSITPHLSLDSQATVQAIEFPNSWDENEIEEGEEGEGEEEEEEEEEEADDDQYYIDNTCDWIYDISRPRSYWEDIRKARYLEVLNTDSEKPEIRQLLERQTVSNFLASDLRERIDKLMISRSQRHLDIESNQGEGVEEKQSPPCIRRDKHVEHDQEQEQDERDEPETNQEQEREREQYHEAVSDLISQSSQMSASVLMRSLSYRDQEANDDQGRVIPLPSCPSDPTNHSSAEIELVCDLRQQMEQLQREMLELRNTIKSCVDFQLHMQKSISQDTRSAHGADTSGPLKRKCCICYDMQVDSLLYRCGHMCTCLKCAHELQWGSGKCPICLAPIIDVVRAFLDS